ncbi:hypothetical protein RB195_023931 [Necator americanus]|uniref:G-protein coupled receptors family 1 profile domain-containing protein n=1 Tax=Necator americanus TaxID=51031 RepID=A0ABR1EL46_NECAM
MTSARRLSQIRDAAGFVKEGQIALAGRVMIMLWQPLNHSYERLDSTRYQTRYKKTTDPMSRLPRKVLQKIGCSKMYVLVQFCKSCNPDPHIEMFITWLGYSNSAMNPIIYTVFNRDYQNALKKLFTSGTKHASSRTG